jgi:hypothetical protein
VEEPNHRYGREKSWSSINHAILSGLRAYSSLTFTSDAENARDIHRSGQIILGLGTARSFIAIYIFFVFCLQLQVHEQMKTEV